MPPACAPDPRHARPSADDVITGLIKANIPTRIAFFSQDRLAHDPGINPAPRRCLVSATCSTCRRARLPRTRCGALSTTTRHKVVEWLRAQGEPEYIDGVLEEVQSLGDGKGHRRDRVLPQDASDGEGGEDAPTSMTRRWLS